MRFSRILKTLVHGCTIYKVNRVDSDDFPIRFPAKKTGFRNPQNTKKKVLALLE